MKALYFVAIGFALLVVAGCSEPTIDASSEESMKESIQQVRESLPEGQRSAFDEAVQVLAFSEIDMADLMAEGATESGLLEAKLRDAIDGKSGVQVIADADVVLAERTAKEKQQAVAEIAELEEKLRQAESAKERLRKFEVLRSRFSMEERTYGGDQPIIELSVRNGIGEAVSRAYFEGVLASPGRSVPWIKDTFNYSISGGLEPGEEATWSLAPNMFSDWGKTKAPADAVLTITVIRLDGADDEPIASGEGLSEYEQERLKELKAKFGQ